MCLISRKQSWILVETYEYDSLLIVDRQETMFNSPRLARSTIDPLASKRLLNEKSQTIEQLKQLIDELKGQHQKREGEFIRQIGLLYHDLQQNRKKTAHLVLKYQQQQKKVRTCESPLVISSCLLSGDCSSMKTSKPLKIVQHKQMQWLATILLSIRSITPWAETIISTISLLRRRNITRAVPVLTIQPRVCRVASIPMEHRHLNVSYMPHRPCTLLKPISNTRLNCRKISFDNVCVYAAFSCMTTINPVNISTIISIVKQVTSNSRAVPRPADIVRCRGRRNRKHHHSKRPKWDSVISIIHWENANTSSNLLPRNRTFSSRTRFIRPARRRRSSFHPSSWLWPLLDAICFLSSTCIRKIFL